MGNCLRKKPGCRVHKSLRNKRLNYCQWYVRWESKGDMTIEQLERLRNAFWDVMRFHEVEGQVWGILEEVVIALLDNKFLMAQTIINMSDLFVPYGDLSYVLDFDGNMYHVPAFTLCVPDNLVKEATGNGDATISYTHTLDAMGEPSGMPPSSSFF